MYRLIVESLLGLRLEVDTLRVAPCLPAHWKAFTVHYRYRETVYHIAVLQTPDGTGETSVTVDGVERHDQAIPLVDDRQDHSVEVRMPAPLRLRGDPGGGRATTDAPAVSREAQAGHIPRVPPAPAPDTR
jgi:hypothetical protein